MLDSSAEDNTPILKERDSTINEEPTLELNDEEDRHEFTNDNWTFTAEERERKEIRYCWENQYLPEAAAPAAPPAGYQEFHQRQLRPELLKLKSRS